MLVVHRSSGTLIHARFTDLPRLAAGYHLVLNNTRVAKARFFSDDGKMELLRLHMLSSREWQCMVRPGKKLRLGQHFHVGGCTGTITGILENGERIIRWDETPDEARHGHLALPPYMKRLDNATDEVRYQTIYARADESRAVAAPTAGLHFTPEILSQFSHTSITLNVGAGTFQPVKASLLAEHVMHREDYEISADAARALSQFKQILAVGTTVTRVLEHCMATQGGFHAHSASTDIFIYPGFRFQAISALLTNFHLPRSTLFMLVCALAGTDLMKRAYAEAVAQRYRFYSYGDCMLIL
jgi:S-adenosylmethionine:tRNA ribosyltransferase-isomerase